MKKFLLVLIASVLLMVLFFFLTNTVGWQNGTLKKVRDSGLQLDSEHYHSWYEQAHLH